MHHELFLKRLFPTYDFRKPYAVKFPVVQYQPNGNDCGVFAIAFAVSLLFNIKPEKIKYDCSLMRSHLIKILETNIIEHFPQDPHSLPIKVPPLAVVKDREVKAAYIRVKRQSEKNYINSKNNSYLTICKINNKNTVCLNNEENNIMCVKSVQGEIVKNKEQENKLEKYHLTNRKSYMKHLEENRKRKRCRYEEKLEDNQALKRCRYEQKLEINRAKDRHRYKKNRVKRCAQRRILYAINIGRKQNQKKIIKTTIKNSNVAIKITKKYKKFWSQNYIKFRNPVAIEDILKKFDIKNHIKKRLEAERILRWCMHIRDSYVRNMYKILALLKKKSEICLTLATECSTIDDKLHALCGISRHTASSENYFIDTYHNITSSQPGNEHERSSYKCISCDENTSKKIM